MLFRRFFLRTTFALLSGCSLGLQAQGLPVSQSTAPVTITIDAAHPVGSYTPAWNYFGADEPNYITDPDGTRLLQEFSAIDPKTPVYFRPHNLLTTGDGVGSLKWGSTNAYTEKPDGTPVYDWTITDKLFDTMRAAHIRPFVEIGFMPEALSPHPQPYRHTFPKGDVFTGWSYPPKDEAKWRALIVAYVTHLHERYGVAVDSWQWEVWNEPDIGYFHGTEEQYFRLYDITTGAIRQVLPKAFVGGPASTGPDENNTLLRDFLQHCSHGVNADSGKPGVPLDFISFHPKGTPKVVDGHVRMNLGKELAIADRGFQIVASFPEYLHTPLILSEIDPEGCAACKGPQNGYRNGTLYAVNTAEMLARTQELARLRGVNLMGDISWSFIFPGQEPFAGFREMATAGGIDKPVLNVFRMDAKLGGQRLPVKSTGAVPVKQIEETSVTASPDIDAIATRDGDRMDILLWNYHDDDLAAPATEVTLNIKGLVDDLHRRFTVTQYRVDHDHSNAYTAWQAMGNPQHLTPQQIDTLRKTGGLEMLKTETISSETPRREGLTLSTALPRQGVALYEITW